jgi:hypothetical protein
VAAAQGAIERSLRAIAVIEESTTSLDKGLAAAPDDAERVFPPRLRPTAWDRAGEPGAVAWRFRVPDGRVIVFVDGLQGPVRRTAGVDFGDFVASSDIDIGQVEGGNPDLEPQKSTVLDVIYERRFLDEGVLTLTWSHAEVEDVVDVIPLAGGFDAVGNIGDGQADYFQIQMTLPTDRLGLPNGRLQARGGWYETSVTDPVTGDVRRFQGNQPFGCGVSFDQDLAGGRWSWGFEHGCNVDRNPNYRVREVRVSFAEPEVHAYGQWKPRSDLTVRVDLGNASDRARGYDREIHTGPRDTAPLSFREVRRTKMSPWLFIQVRKSF